MEATKTLRGYQTSRISVDKEFVSARTQCYFLKRDQLEAKQSLHRYQREALDDVRLEIRSRKEEESRREKEAKDNLNQF